MSCPNTPQQNGLAERKHRHVTELDLALMFQSKVPQQLWADAFLTATYLGNLLPSLALPGNISPYEALVKKPPVYTSLRVFGSSCYPFLRPYGQNKFDPKSLHCVFIGYSEKHKGYRCLHPPTARVYISRHVLFNESKFPYQTEYKSFLEAPTSRLLDAWKAEFLPPSAPPSVTAIPEEEIFLPRRHQPPPPVTAAAAPSPQPTASLFSEDDFPPLSPPAPAVVVPAPAVVVPAPPVAAPVPVHLWSRVERMGLATQPPLCTDDGQDCISHSKVCCCCP